MEKSSQKRSVTLADVAKMAGVAMMTVSRYLNGHPNVTAKTAHKIQSAIDTLRYRPNLAARMLMGQPSGVIGLIVPNLANPFFSSIAHSVQQTAYRRGYLVWIAATNDQAKTDLELIEKMRDHHVDGILLTASPRAVLKPSILGNVPLVAIDRPATGVSIDFVTIDDRSAAREAVNHLIAHGYKRIACLGLVSEIHSIQERISGYQDAMHAHNLTPLPYVECEDLPSTLRAIRKAMSGRSHVQAIFPVNSWASILALEAMLTLRYSIPRDVAFLSYGELPLGHIFQPSISAVSQPTSELGERATEFLLDRITSKKPGTGIRMSIPATLVLRHSCGCK